MRILKSKFASIFVMFLLIGAGAVAVSAQDEQQEKPGNDRPVVVYYYDPFMSWDRWWYDPYMDDPYLRERRSLYYRREAVRDARSELCEHLMEYNEDGVITADEREELNDNRADLNEARADLREYRREEGYIDHRR